MYYFVTLLVRFDEYIAALLSLMNIWVRYFIGQRWIHQNVLYIGSTLQRRSMALHNGSNMTRAPTLLILTSSDKWCTPMLHKGKTTTSTSSAHTLNSNVVTFVVVWQHYFGWCYYIWFSVQRSTYWPNGIDWVYFGAEPTIPLLLHMLHCSTFWSNGVNWASFGARADYTNWVICRFECCSNGKYIRFFKHASTIMGWNHNRRWVAFKRGFPFYYMIGKSENYMIVESVNIAER